MEKRINSMIDYAYNTTDCRERKIVNYFGEDTASDCGHCDICIEKKKASPSDKELADSIFYMLSLKGRTLKDFIETLSFQPKDIADMVRFLLDEGKIKVTNGLFSLK